MELILASNNEKKLKELRAILTGMGHSVISQREAGLDFVAEETGGTFLENARIKAQAVVEATGRAAIADDSGLCVEALDGEPGVDSAYYGGERCVTDRDRMMHLLSNMEGTAERRGYFVSAIVCLIPDGEELVCISAEGRVEGEILREPRGEGGFGYDPVFYVPEAGQTLAEMSAEEKNQVSHRGRALLAFKEEWEKHYDTKQ
ncbi:MAG: RdgB/HAM1 family non-canonical purine NTP pyrophosphatase [Oscillospiraceae bacterium]|nr:RdgB/HAM1 family non-canonical purine NTP pyrophosphatase [Oscillospiraceae bacterium]